MPYVHMTIVLAAWTSLAFVYRWAERLRAQRLAMAAGMALVVLAGNALVAVHYGANLGGVSWVAYLLGALLGINFAVGIPLFLAAVARGEMSITWTVLALSFALAACLGLVFPGERITWVGLAGLGLSSLAIVLLGLDATRKRTTGGGFKKRWPLFMGLSFLLNALSMYTYTLADHFGPANDMRFKLAFLLSFAAVALLCSGVLLRLFPLPGSRKSGLLAGAAGGACMFAGALFTMLALGAGVPGHVLYPATTGGSILLVAILSSAFLKEKPGRWGWAGIATGVLAIALLGASAAKDAQPPRGPRAARAPTLAAKQGRDGVGKTGKAPATTLAALPPATGPRPRTLPARGPQTLPARGSLAVVAAARAQVGQTVAYDPAYVVLAYPGGDVPLARGVCTDVVIRALRQGLQLDLQKLVHEDMQKAFAEYPQQWGLSRPDANIDHRRVPNLQRYFERQGYSLPVTAKAEDYLPGDLVTCTVAGKLPHIMVVSDRKAPEGAPLVIHNIGQGAREEARLFEFPLTGHYRISPKRG